MEDTDSIVYLRNIDGFLHLNFAKYLSDPDTCPFYPFLGAVFSLPGWSVEIGARMASLAFSILLFITLGLLGFSFLSVTEVLFGLFLLCFSPVLIPLSFAVLTEPSYVAVIYLGFFIFWKQYKNPTFWSACLLGMIFGASFLNRLEGIFFFAVVPFWQVSYYLYEGKKQLPLKQLLQWVFIYLAVFTAVMSPQIYKVSNQMGKFALNGRQVYSIIRHMPGSESEIEKLFGLTYSPKVLNIEYLSKNAQVLNRYQSGTNPVQYVKTVANEFNILCQKQLGEIIGPFAMILFGFGLLAMYRDRLHFNIFLIISFIGVNLAGPLLHNVAIRHIISIAPIMFLVGGGGMGYLRKEISSQSPVRRSFLKNPAFITMIAACICLLAWIVPLRRDLNPPAHNAEYSPKELKEPIAIIKKISARDLKQPPNVASERGYLAYFSKGYQFYLPFADLEAFIRYCHLNNINFFYLNHLQVKKKGYPFYKHFENSTPSGFTPVYEGVDDKGNRTTLFLVDKID
ncbi:MAG: hypothetical protein C0403_14680 [Desulfobacterium sp.]|nr:hypothetical protein [Desulfobacterium sp.]